MNILCVGDVVGSAGCAHLRRLLPVVKRQYAVDLCIVNGENAADGNGITPAAAEHILDSGADAITAGNHTYRRREFYELLDGSPCIIRPGNYPASAPGKGWCVVDKGRFQVTVINLMGVVYMEPLACPFETLDRLLEERGEPQVRNGAKLADLLRRPRLTYADLAPFDPDRPALDPAVAREAEITIKYAGYIDRQLRQVEEMRRLEDRVLPRDMDYLSIHGLRMEARQKLQDIRPRNLGQASRVSGVSPADVAVLMIYLKQAENATH